MTLPKYDVSNDPGPSFIGLLKTMNESVTYDVSGASPEDLTQITHGTTVVAAKCADGVVIAGDRRATSGNLISYRTMKKVFPADKWSGVAIAGAAGPAIEMVKMFQLQLEHYEKVEGHSLSLEGKANQLSQMLRANLPAAMQGMVVVPLFAGYDKRRELGRLFAYDVTGGRYEESEYISSGSGSMFARTAIKMEFDPGMTKDKTVDLLIKSLFTAADDDSATGGPDAMRGIYPLVATITSDGYQELEESEIAQKFERVLEEFTPGGSTK